ncbi:hypothetical protein ACB092_03G050900 [Castanea dentata]
MPFGPNGIQRLIIYAPLCLLNSLNFKRLIISATPIPCSFSGYANCYSCWEQLSTSSKVFNCSDCDFYLHKSCSLDLIEHYRDYKHILNSFHSHPLEIFYYDREAPGVVCCTLCHKCCFGPTYVCFLCNFFLNQSCLELLGRSTISQNSFHKNPLIIVENKANDSASFFFMNNDFPSCSACSELENRLENQLHRYKYGW